MENVLEVSNTKTTEAVQEQTFTAPDNSDLLIVPWVFSKAVLLYREENGGRIELISGSEEEIAQTYKSYPLDQSKKLQGVDQKK